MVALLLAVLPSAIETRSGLGGTEGPDLTRYVVVCAILCLAIAGLALGFRRLVATSLRAKAAGRALQILDVLPLGGKQRLCVVRCYDRTFALGQADHAVALIAELDPVIGEDRPAAAPSEADARAFAQALQSAPPKPPRSRGRPVAGGGLLA